MALEGEEEIYGEDVEGMDSDDEEYSVDYSNEDGQGGGSRSIIPMLLIAGAVLKVGLCKRAISP